MREASRSWTEAYPAMEYRHGPISIAGPGRVTWMLGTAPEGLREQVEATGGTFFQSGLDPMAELVRAQRAAVARAFARGSRPGRAPAPHPICDPFLMSLTLADARIVTPEGVHEGG